MKINQKRRGAALTKIKELMDDAKNVLIIHYSCESFYNRPDGTSPKITSIAIRKLNDGQTRCFSIHQEAELQHISVNRIPDEYTKLEKAMLKKFFAYIEKNSDKTFVHWNMRDSNYGFGAIEFRFQIFRENPIIIDDDKKVDLARLLVDIYGVGYIEHPRLESLIKLNQITDCDFLTGKQEAEAFENKQYIALHRSTARKVDIFANIIQRIDNKMLKTNTRYWELHGGKLRSICFFLYTNIYICAIVNIFALIGFISTIIKLFN